MPTYRITNATSGHCLGEFAGEDEQGALDEMSQDAGYRDHAHACEVTEDDGSDLSVVEVDEGPLSKITAVVTGVDGPVVVADVSFDGQAIGEVTMRSGKTWGSDITCWASDGVIDWIESVSWSERESEISEAIGADYDPPDRGEVIAAIEGAVQEVTP